MAATVFSAPKSKPESVGPAKIVVIDPLDLNGNQVKAEVGDLLRKALPVSEWSVIPADSVSKKLREFGQNPEQGCNNNQCAFDVGNILQVDFVLFGTSTVFGRVDAHTLKLMHVPTAQIVWVNAFESPLAYGDIEQENLSRAFAQQIGKLRRENLDLSKATAKKTVAVIDLSENPQTARIFFERVFTRIYGVRHYDLMAPSELVELLGALEINKYSIVPSVENMVGLGQKLGVGYLLYSRLYRDGNKHVYRLAFYDIVAKKLVLELPPQPSEDEAKLLDYERVFFNTLAERNQYDEKPAAKAGIKPKSHFNKALWISLGVLGVGGGLAALWVGTLGNSGSPPDPENPAGVFGFPLGPPSDKEQ